MTTAGIGHNTEVWVPVPGYERHYEISNFGAIRSLARTIRQRNHWREFVRIYPGAPLAPARMSGGYPGVTLCKDGRRTSRHIHAIVAEAFLGACPEEKEVRHIDGDPRNCRLSNLKYGTPTENAADRIRHGTQVRGEAQGSAKLTEAEVIHIRFTRGPLAEMAELYGVSITTISKIRLGHSWKHIAPVPEQLAA